jgi:hypothetical protein
MEFFVCAARFTGYRYPRFAFAAGVVFAREKTGCELLFRTTENRSM